MQESKEREMMAKRMASALPQVGVCFSSSYFSLKGKIPETK